MKSKTIKKILNSKLTEWISTITDEKVKELVRRDAIVTGGSIASMLLREEVNDFDIYFKTKECVKAVAKYYVKKIGVSSDILDVVDGATVLGKGDWVGGNLEDQSQWKIFTNNLTPERIKIWCKSVGYYAVEKKEDGFEEDTIPQLIQSEVKEEQQEKEKYRPIYFTPNAITLSDQVQLIVRFYGEASEIHHNYDFVHATNYYDFSEDKLVLYPEALESLLTKELKYIGSVYPLTSVLRTKKFIKRNWTISAGTYLKILWQTSKLDLSDIRVLEEQLIGVDIAYFSTLIEALRTVEDKSKLNDYSYISEIIDRIFG